MLRWCPGCPPGLRPDDFRWRLGLCSGPSTDGGFDELLDDRRTCSSNAAILADCFSIIAMSWTIFASNSQIRSSRQSGTHSFEHAAIDLSISYRV